MKQPAPTAVQFFDPFRVRPLPDQPRKRFRGIDELAASIAEVGQSMPGIVTLVDDDKAFDAQLVDGERRLRACRKLKHPFRAEVRAADGPHEAFVASFAANFGKQDHDCIEIAQGLLRMQSAGKSAKQLAAISGRNECWVYQHLSLNSLHPDVQQLLIPGDDGEQPALALSVAFLLVPLPRDRQIAIARRIGRGGGMSMLAARRLIINERRKAGDGDPGMGRQNGRSLTSLASLATAAGTIRHRLGVYLDMPGPELAAVVAADLRRAVNLLEVLEDAEEDLAGLRQAIDRELLKHRRKAS